MDKTKKRKEVILLYTEEDFFRLRELRYKSDLTETESNELNQLSEKEKAHMEANPGIELSNVDPEWIKQEEEKKRLETDRIKREGLDQPTVVEETLEVSTQPENQITDQEIVNEQPQTPEQNIPQDFIPADDEPETHQESYG